MKHTIDKIESAIGSFWGGSFFVGVIVAVIIGRAVNLKSDWFWVILIGLIVFLILGLFIQGILTLFNKERVLV